MILEALNNRQVQLSGCVQYSDGKCKQKFSVHFSMLFVGFLGHKESSKSFFEGCQ
jgi:hypothetical protein